MEVSSVPTKNGSIAEGWDYDSIITKLRGTECSLLLERFFDSNTLLHVAASIGHDQIVEAILSKQQCQQEILSATNSSGDLPLHVAANAGHLPIVVQFLGRPCSKHQELLKAQNSNGDLPLHVAANAGHLSIVQHLVESHLCQELLMVKNSNGDLPLHVAANAGHLSIVQHLIESSDSSHQCQQELLTAKNSRGDHPLHVAVNAGHLYIVEHLLNSSHQAQNSEVNVASKLLTGKNNEGNTPLHLALIKKYEEADENLKSKYNEVAKLLIETDPIVFNYRNKAQKYPYGMAIEAEDKELLELMKHKFESSPKPSPDSGDAKMKIDAEEREPSIPKRVPQKSRMDPNLYMDVKKKEIVSIIARDTEQSALSDKTPELNTILHLAAANSDDDQFVHDILKIQLCQKFVTEKNSNGDLPLHVAVSAGNMQIVELLVKLSNEQLKDHCDCVPLVEKNMEGNTPFHLALIKKIQVGRKSDLKAKFIKVAKFLVEKCPEVSFYPNKEHKSPLYLAVEGGDEELMKHMITKNLLPHGKSIVHAAIYYLTTISNLKYGKSIVHTAIYGSFAARKDILDTVLKSLPDDILTEKDNTGMTPLFYAASIGYLDGVEILLKKPKKCCAYDQRDKDGYYPIHIASKNGHIKIVQYFLDNYPDMIELLNKKGQNILHVAAMYRKANMLANVLKTRDLKVEMLINNEDEEGNTPLHLAAKGGHPKVVSNLTWDKRVDLKSLNKEGKRAVDIALDILSEKSSKSSSIRRAPIILTREALRYVSGPRAPEKPKSSEVRQTPTRPPEKPKSSEVRQTPTRPPEKPKSSEVRQTPTRPPEKPKSSEDEKTSRTDRLNTLSLVATLVATVTFAAAFTMPGGYKESGNAKFLEKPMFHVFVISNSIAMYSAITVVVALLWAYFGDINLVVAAIEFTAPMLGLAITMVSLAFMAGNYLVLRDLNWLAYLVLSIGSFFLFVLSIIFFPLCSPMSSPHRIVRYILSYPFYVLIKFTRCDTDDREEE